MRLPDPVLNRISFVLVCPSVFLFAATCNAAESVGQKRGVIDRSEPLQMVHPDFELADGAAWDGRGSLFVPDVKGKRLLVFNLRKPAEAPRVRNQGLGISGCCYQLGKLYVSDNANSRIAVFSQTGPPKTLAQLDPKKRPNDLVVDAVGNVYVTITGEGCVRRIEANAIPDQSQGDAQMRGRAGVFVDHLDSPNGIALSPDGATLYVSSAKTGLISKITIDAAVEKQKAVAFAQLESTENGFRGDGMCVDRAGNVYCTGAQTVTVFDPNGNKIDQLRTPERPINVVMGGIEGRTLFISTFGGLYRQSVHAYAVSPNPPISSGAAAPSGNSSENDDLSTQVRGNLSAKFNVVYADIDGRRLLMDVFTPSASRSSPNPAIIVVHGGGWVKGDKTKFRALSLRLAERGYVVAAIEYRLAHETKFPAAIRDCNAATSYLRKNAARYGIDPNRIAAVGGSAGGHLVGLMAHGAQRSNLKHPSASDMPSVLQAAVVMAGPLQIATGSIADRSRDPAKPSYAVQWIGGTIDELPEQYHLADADEKIDAQSPPTLFIVGSLDNPARNQAARNKLKALGIATGLITHEGAKHGHWNQADWIARVVADIDSFLKLHL
ncbi:MAG: alpha/beta hydrolase fold domain-containing protein [Pirellulaceae bacterium]|nr:alpha/beta hydrolase fold domain-containing protein [Pirellulaceae bacterium]